MNYLLALLLLLLTSSGCSGFLVHQAMQQKDLTPAEIEAFQKVGSKVHSCTNLSGPPPVGSWTFILLPQSSNQVVRFGPQCQVVMQ